MEIRSGGLSSKSGKSKLCGMSPLKILILKCTTIYLVNVPGIQQREASSDSLELTFDRSWPSPEEHSSYRDVGASSSNHRLSGDSNMGLHFAGLPSADQQRRDPQTNGRERQNCDEERDDASKKRIGVFDRPTGNPVAFRALECCPGRFGGRFDY
jgi:hypothetical protein